MYSSLPTAKLMTGNATDAELETSPILIELTKKAHFCRFLEKEMRTARTEAEKEAVQTILLKTKIEIRAIEEEWKRSKTLLQGAGRTVPKKMANAYASPRLQ
jgi:hypothetical protein